MHWLKWVIIVGAVFALDRLLLWFEDRGWLYYRKRRPNITSLGTALFQVQAIIQPEKQHVVEHQLEIREDEDDEAGKPPKPKATALTDVSHKPDATLTDVSHKPD
jgi:hypothetical protein